MIERIWRPDDLLIFTSNGVVKKDGRLVMGRGIARVVRDYYSGIDRVFGKLVSLYGNKPFLIYARKFGKPECPLYVMSFPTKHHWKQSSDPELIRKSKELAVKIIENKKNSLIKSGIIRILCPLWGTENGGLSLEEVRDELINFKNRVEKIGFKVCFFNKKGIVELKQGKQKQLRR